MKGINVTRIEAAVILAGAIGLTAWTAAAVHAVESPSGRLAIDYPAAGTIFPPDFTSPTFIWHDAAEKAKMWRIDVTFADGYPAIHVETPGPRMTLSEIDPRCVSPNNELPKLTSEQSSSHSWVPDRQVWETIAKSIPHMTLQQ